MEKASWNTGRQFSSAGEDGPRGEDGRRRDDMEFWKSVLSNSHLRSRFIRDLEVQSITSRSAEDLVLRYRQEEILPRR